MHKIATRSLVGALVGALVVGSVAPAAQAAPRHDDTKVKSAVDDLHALGVTGVQGITRVDGHTTTARAGAGTPDNGYFRMGSDTKTFVAIVLLQLVGEGRLSLDDTVDHWLPGVVSGNGNDGRKITVRQVLQHTSGVPNYTGDVPSITSAEGYQEHRFDHWTAARLVALAMTHPPLFAPGTSWSYSNTNYILAGMIIKRVTGHSWADEVKSRIVEPLGLRETYYPGDTPTLRNPHAEGYNQFAPGGPLVDTTLVDATVADAAGGLVSTPSDLARFWQALQAGRLLKPAQMAQLHTTVPAPDLAVILPGARYGLGILWSEDKCGGHWSHYGDVPGFSTVDAVSADGKRVIVMSLSSELADEQTVMSIYQRVGQAEDDALCS